MTIAAPPQPSLDRDTYCGHNLVERLISKLEHFRRAANRCEKRAETFLAMVKIAIIRLWL